MSEQSLSGQTLRQLPLRILPAPLLLARRAGLGGRGSAHLIERHARVYRHTWLVLASGFFEPLFYLLSIGVGIGELVGKVTFAGHAVPLHQLRGARAAGDVRYERGDLRLDFQHLLPAQVRQALRRGAGNADGPRRRGARRSRLGTDPGRPLRVRVHGHHAGDGPGALGLGCARHPCRAADRVRASPAPGWRRPRSSAAGRTSST